jgi:hypothetical protein
MLRQRFQLCRTVSRCGFRVGQEENGPVPRRSHGWQNSGTLLRVAVSVKLPANPLARRDKGGRIWSQAGQPSRSSPATTAPATPPGWATATQAILNVTNPNRRELGRSNPLALRNLSFAYQVIHGTQNIPRCEPQMPRGRHMSKRGRMLANRSVRGTSSSRADFRSGSSAPSWWSGRRNQM